MMKDMKALLKEARDAIKSKDYETSLRISKQILKENKDNYTALVFLGVSLQETGGQLDQASKAFRAAIKIDPNNPLAWNGLINYYEKLHKMNETTTKSTEELVQCFINLFKIETNEKKLIEYCEKLTKLPIISNDRSCGSSDGIIIVQIATEMFQLIENKKVADFNRIYICLIDLLSKLNNNLPKELYGLYQQALIGVLNSDPKATNCIEYYNEYLNLLYKQEKYTELIENAKKMHSLFELDTISLKWICKIFNETFIETEQLIIIEEEEEPSTLEIITNFCQKLLNSDSKSEIGLLTKAILLILLNNDDDATDDRQQQLNQAKDLLKDVINLYPTLLHAYILLIKILMKLHSLQDAINVFKKIVKLSFSTTIEDKKKHSLTSSINLLLVEALSKSDKDEDLLHVIEYEKTLPKDDGDLINIYSPHIIRAYINLGKFTQAKLLLSSSKNYLEHNYYKLLNAQLLHKQKEYNKALLLLLEEEEGKTNNESIKISEWWLEIGQLYWEIGRYEKCLIPFLKAAKYDSAKNNNYYYKCFLYLGHYYNHKFINDIDKARRCYEKSFKLSNQQCSEAGIELSKIYRQLKNWDANLNLLTSLTTPTTTTSGNVINKQNSWAWLQLGLHYLEQQEYDRAINNLRLVIRIDSNNINCWESLADSYLAKGAYTSALKCYNRALEIAVTATTAATIIYPLLQTANIKQILGEYVEARQDFNGILQTNPKYVPALKGIAETCFLQAKECFSRDQRMGTCRDHLQYAAEKLILAIHQRNDLSCLWKLLGDCCYFCVAKLPEKYRCLLLQSSFVMQNNNDNNDLKENQIVEDNDLYELALKCYCKSTTLINNNNLLLWHDFATCLLSYSLKIANVKFEKSEKLLKKCTTIVQYCTINNPTYWQHWNLLGICTFYLNNYKKSQHSFIKAIIASNNNSAISWSNLGVLYLILDQYQLANKAFSQAQRSDPNYVNSWIGQAILAETLQHNEDAMDLFRHSTQLGMHHQQGALGYGYWVCKTLLLLKQQSQSSQLLLHDDNRNIYYSIYNMHAIPVACDNLTWYTEKDPDDPCAWNLLGILQERIGLNKLSIESFGNALYLIEDDKKKQNNNNHRDLARINTARLLAKSGKYAKASKLYGQVEKATFNSACGKALALFKDQRYQDSYEAYEQALHWLTDDDNDDEQSAQSELLVALAAMAYMFQGEEAAKTLLFQSIHLEQPSPWGFYATFALSILHQNHNLAELVFKELNALVKHHHRQDCIQHFAIFSSYYYLLKGDPRKAVVETSKLIHCHPEQTTVWLTLSQLLIRLQFVNECAAKCAHNAMKLGRRYNIDVTKILSIVSLASFIAKQYKNSLLTAQKAIHCYPNLAENWSVLILSLINDDDDDGNKNDKKKQYIDDILQFIELLLNITPNSNGNLYNWIQVIKKSF